MISLCCQTWRWYGHLWFCDNLQDFLAHKEYLFCYWNLQTVTWRFLSSTEVGIPTTSRHSALLYCSWAYRLLSNDAIQFKRLLFTILVTTKDNSTWSSWVDKLSTVLNKLSKIVQNFSIDFSQSSFKFSTKAIRFSFFKSFNVFSV